MTPAAEDFADLDLRVGTIRSVRDFPEARVPAWILDVDFGPDLGRRRSSARLKDRYEATALEGRQVVAVINIGDRQIGPVQSQCLILGLPDAEGHTVLLTPDGTVPDGGRVS